MTDTDWCCPEEKWDRLAMLYVPHGGDSFPYEELGQGRHARAAQSTVAAAGWSRARSDYQRFMTMLLRGGELDGVRLVSSRTLELMTRNHLPDDVDLEEFATDSYLRDQLRRHRLRARVLGRHRLGEEPEPRRPKAPSPGAVPRRPRFGSIRPRI